MAYRTRYTPRNKKKYVGPTPMVCRSNWERQFAKYCDASAKVKKWNMEGVIIPYYDQSSGKNRRYFMDFFLEMTNGDKFIIEIKPKIQTEAPKQGRKKRKRFLSEVLTYGTNQSKWAAAKEYANKRGWKFLIYTENELKDLGLKLIINKARSFKNVKKKK